MLTRVIAIVVIMAAMGANVIQQPAAPGGGPTCGAGASIAEDFDGATSGLNGCSAHTADNAVDCTITSAGTTTLDATSLSGDMYTGEEGHFATTSSFDEGYGTLSLSGSEFTGYCFMRFSAIGVDTDTTDYHRSCGYGSTSGTLCVMGVQQISGTDEFVLFSAGTTVVDTFTPTIGTDYIIEVHALENGATDECDWRIWECGTAGNIADCPSTPTQTGSFSGAYNTDINAVFFGVQQSRNEPATAVSIGEVHVSTGSTWLCS